MYRGSNFWNFTYDANGMRTGRSSSSTTYTYVYNGSQLSRMTCGSNTLLFTYGADGSPLSLTYNGTTYYYVVNLQGDVVAILNSSGAKVVSYTYDAWGRLLTTSVVGTANSNLALHNPLRYRGYVYDRETGLYYLQSRYYNPTIGRFINADVYPSTGQGLLGNNMFAYCNNNPVNNADPAGMWTISFSLGGDFTFFFFGASISIGIAFDDEANIAVQWSYSVSNYLNDDQTYSVGMADIGVGGSLQITDDNTIYDLEGAGCYAGFTAGSGFFGGMDMVYSGVEAMDEKDADTLPNGVQFGLGYGFGFDTHFRQTKTSTLWVIN